MIEPTEEQKEAVRTWCTRELATTYGWHPIARFLAEREAKLREELADFDELMRVSDIHNAEMRAELHTERLVAEKALAARNEMENERDAARRDLACANDERARANGYLLAAQKSEMAMKGQLAEARARVAELEAREKFRDLAAAVDTGEPVDALLMRTLSARVAELEASLVETSRQRMADNGRHKANASQIIASLDVGRLGNSIVEEAIRRYSAARETQHLADIKALRPLFDRVKEAQFENYEDAYRAIYKCGGYDLVKQADAVFAHYDDAKADAPASDADIESRVLAGAFARRRNASTEGGEG